MFLFISFLIMPIYSFSQIQTYLQCPLKYKFRYIDKIIPEFEENLNLILWTTVHDALEYLYTQINVFQKPTLEEIQQYFKNKFDENSKNIDVLNKEKEEFLIRWLVYLENYYKRKYPFDDVKIIWTEIQLYIDLWDNIKFQGFIDRLDKTKEAFIINDYKTNKNLPPEDKTLYEEQLTLYALWVKQKYGKYFDKIFWNLEYLHFDINDTWEITVENIYMLVKKYKGIIQEIEKKKVEYNLWDENSFKVKESSLCKFCDYKEICPLFSHFCWKITDEDLSEETIKNLIDEYVKLSKQKSEIERKMKQNKEILEQFARRHKLKKLYGNECKISISSLVNYKIKDKEKLKEVLYKLWKIEEVLDIDRFKLKKLIESNTIDLSSLDWLIERSESSVFRGNFVSNGDKLGYQFYNKN